MTNIAVDEKFIEESYVDMLVEQMIKAVRNYGLDLNLVRRSSDRLVQRFLEECKYVHPQLCVTVEVHSEVQKVKDQEQKVKRPTKKSKDIVAKKKCSPTSLIDLPSEVDYCSFCKNNGTPPEVYKSHIVRDPVSKKVVCPSLRSYKCPYCGNQDKDYAHTKSHCPFQAAVLEGAQKRRSK